MDDIIIMGRIKSEHDTTLKNVLEMLCQNNLKINGSKIQFAIGEVILLCIKINGKQQSPNEMKK